MADHICPWWMGYLLANPLRRIIENPDKILGRFVKEGMTAVDYGCGMGFFTLPLAKMVGPGGKVIAVDVQKKMLDSLNKRAQRAGLLDRIEPVLVNGGKTVINGPVDFVAALYVVHELPDTKAFFSQMVDVMKQGAKLLMVEPGFHVTEKDFRDAVNTATSIGLKMTDEQVFIRGRAAVLEAPGS
jgi:ubiquinone/menaquinone biosynthesis C-methylase UbiE